MCVGSGAGGAKVPGILKCSILLLPFSQKNIFLIVLNLVEQSFTTLTLPVKTLLATPGKIYH